MKILPFSRSYVFGESGEWSYLWRKTVSSRDNCEQLLVDVY